MAQEHGGHGGAFHAAMQQSMAAMVREMAAVAMTGDPDQDFLAMMIPHHRGAVEMAGALLVHGRDPLVRQLADEIIASQQTEIASMQARLALLRAGRGGEDALHGTRGPASR